METSTRTVTIELTAEQADNLADSLVQCQDEGPTGSGWAYDSMVELRRIVNEAILNYHRQTRIHAEATMETPTPETDAACDDDKGWGWSGLAPIELCRKLERERDEARAEVAELQPRWCPACFGPMTDTGLRGDPKCSNCGLEIIAAT